MGSLPETAGKAMLQWSKSVRRPTRDGLIITLPYPEEGSEILLLDKGRQFVYHVGCSGWFFGGTDENPFLVEIERKLFYILKVRGQEAFYEALKPGIIRYLEQRFKIRSKRQGDIFAIRLPLINWQEILAIILVLRAWESRGRRVDDFVPAGDYRVLETRHQLEGRCIEIYVAELQRYIDHSCRYTPLEFIEPEPPYPPDPSICDIYPSFQLPERIAVAEGVLKAEDHSDRKLTGPHLLAQAEGLSNPQRAD